MGFQNAGYDSLALDWRGQGLSQRLSENSMVGHVKQYADYQMDVAALLEAAEALAVPKPWFLFGHSLGGCIGLRALVQGMPVQACAFTAPLWDIKLSFIQRALAWPLSWAAQTVGMADQFAPGTRGESYVLNTEFEENRLTQDLNMYRYYQRISEELSDQQIGGPSLGWLFQTLKETRRLSRLPSPHTPCLTLCGEHDTIVSVTAAKDRMKRWELGELRLVKNARHDVLYEVKDVRNGVFQSLLTHFENSAGPQ